MFSISVAFSISPLYRSFITHIVGLIIIHLRYSSPVESIKGVFSSSMGATRPSTMCWLFATWMIRSLVVAVLCLKTCSEHSALRFVSLPVFFLCLSFMAAGFGFSAFRWRSARRSMISSQFLLIIEGGLFCAWYSLYPIRKEGYGLFILSLLL